MSLPLWRSDRLSPLLLAMLRGGIATYAFATTVFGDGTSEGARYFLPGALAVYSAPLAAIVGIPSVLIRWHGPRKESVLERSAGIVSIATAASACVLMLQWCGTPPLAIGVLDMPSRKRVSASGAQLRGWALDPYGVDSVRLHLGALERNFQYGAGRPDFEAAYPGYPDAARAGFSIDLKREDLAQASAPNPVRLQVEVKNRNGVVTEMDARNLEFLR